MRTRIYYCLILILSLSGCCRDQDLTLSPTIGAWLPYDSQQAVTFFNPGGQKLVFVAERSQYNLEGSDKVCGSYDIETQQVTLTSPEDPNFHINITISHQVLIGLKVWREDPHGQAMDISFNTISENYVSDPYRDKFYKQISLNGRTYANVIYAFGLPNSGPLSFAEVYYGRETGLIGFKLFSGESYFLP